MTYAIENIRLKELFSITEQNEPFYRHFEQFVKEAGFLSIQDFVTSLDQQRCISLIQEYFETPLPENVDLLDGIARPYPADKAKWLFLGWLLRDAPEQRLKPMLKDMIGNTVIERRAQLINCVREDVAMYLNEEARWSWIAVSEVIMDRLEGSRRAIKGTLFEAIVRRLLRNVFARCGISASVKEKGTQIDGETYDVVVAGKCEELLIPVKTRETMGGGHALLFTRDIDKSIRVASINNYNCLPIVIAESWGGNLQELSCDDYIYIDKNPNQIRTVESLLVGELEKRVSLFQTL